jgi:hypothetical protein
LGDEGPCEKVYIGYRPVVDRYMRLTIGSFPTYRVAMGLGPPSYFALAALIDGPLHGYAISQRARELSGGRVRLSTGTLYALLERALVQSLVVAGEPYVEGGRQRRDYTLTPAGRALLADDAAS